MKVGGRGYQYQQIGLGSAREPVRVGRILRHRMVPISERPRENRYQTGTEILPYENDLWAVNALVRKPRPPIFRPAPAGSTTRRVAGTLSAFVTSDEWWESGFRETGPAGGTPMKSSTAGS